MKSYADAALSLLIFSNLGPTSTSCTAFVGDKAAPVFRSFSRQLYSSVRDGIALIDDRTGKPTGTSFLPDDAIERAMGGNPIEKFKLEKDGTSAWVDIYDYAAKIRAGELTWEDVEKGDMDNVSFE